MDRHAEKRVARIYAEVASLGASADAAHYVMPDPTGRGAALAIRNALGDAGARPEDVDYVNMHATSTPQGDVAETRAIALSLSATKA